MKAGFARVSITPPLGTPMMGFGSRDREKGCTGVHDDVFVRAAYLEHAGEAALLMGFDLCFVGRADSDRMKAAIGKKLGLAPKQILLNASHNHVGPMVGTWYDAHPSLAYLKLLDDAVLKAAVQAKEKACEATAWAGATKSAVPMNRRRKDERGVVENRPNPGGVVCDHLPICLLKDVQGKPVCLIFSVSCHPSMISGWDISAEFPGAAMDKLDAHLGGHVSLFLQGAGGDAKPSVAGKGVDRWRPCTWADVAQAGHMLADEVIQALNAGLVQVQPRIRTEMTEVLWPMQPPMDKDKYAAIAADPKGGDVRRLWAKKIVEKLDRGEPLPTSVPILVQGIQLGKGLRLIGLEGEAVGGLGLHILSLYRDGVTFPMGYCNGEGLYLPTSNQIDEGGYEVMSFWEYGFPARLAKGFESILTQALAQLRARGVE